MICGDRSAALLTVVDPWVISASNRCYQIELAMLPWKYCGNAEPANCKWFADNGWRSACRICRRRPECSAAGAVERAVI